MKVSLTLPLTLLVTCVFVTCAHAWKAKDPFYATQYANVAAVRSLLVDGKGDLLAVSPTSSSIYVVYETGSNSSVATQVLVNGNGLGLNHGIAYNQGYLYASSISTVYRWPYSPGQRSPVSAQAQTVIRAIPTGEHGTRTLIFDRAGKLYVSVGSNSNVDSNSDRARIRRFSSLNNLPIDFSTGEVFADGLRNEVGLGFDLRGILYGVENSADKLSRSDLGDIHNGNPAEELNRFDQAVGTHYGYPYCFSTYDLPNHKRGSQLAWPTFMNDGIHTDAFCQNITKNRPPVLALPAHFAPLGIDFYRGQNCASLAQGAFPCRMIGNAAIAFHGSSSSDSKVGYKVSMVSFNMVTGLPAGEELVDVIFEENTSGCNPCLRPVNAVFNKQGHLFVSSDSTGDIFRVTYGMPAKKLNIL